MLAMWKSMSASVKDSPSSSATVRSWAGVGAFTAMVGLPEDRCGWSLRVGRQLGADMNGEGLGQDVLGGRDEAGDRRRVVVPVHRSAVGEALIGGEQLGPVSRLADIVADGARLVGGDVG